MTQLPIERIKAVQAAGAQLFAEAGLAAEPPGVALAVEKHRWAWRPPTVKVVLLAESHIYTSVSDFALIVLKEALPTEAQQTPAEFVRIIYCLGYGEPQLLSGKTDAKNAGTRQFWDLFARLARLGKPPRRSQGASLEQRLRWKVNTLTRLQRQGIWVLDASLHAMYIPGGKRVPNRLKFALHQLWWEQYGSYVLSQIPQAKVWIIGKTVADDLKKLKIPWDGWIYQPGAGRSPSRNLEQGWPELLKDIEEGA
ncbi:MAG: hypothetical protein ACFB4I_21680 [Cyanophyceae cyanobacterium]